MNVSLSVNQGVCTPPAAPKNLTTVAGFERVKLSWSPPDSNGGSQISSYLVQFSNDNGQSWSNYGTPAINTSNFAVNGLINGTGYLFKVAALNALGQSDFSSPSALVVSKISVPDQPENVKVTIITGESLTGQFTWNSPKNDGGSSITKYELRVGFLDSSGAFVTGIKRTILAISGAQNYTYNFGLAPNYSYAIRLVAINAQGASDYAMLIFTTSIALPPPPTNLSGIAGAKRVTLNWSPPVGTGFGDVNDYAIQYSFDEGATWLDYIDNASADTNASVLGLNDQILYFFRVASRNAIGQGRFSESVTIITPESCLDKPDGLSETRSGYKKFLVPSGATCEPTQSIRICQNGVFSTWSAPATCSSLSRFDNNLTKIDLQAVASAYGKTVRDYLKDEFSRYRPAEFTLQDLDIFSSYDSTNKSVVWNNNYLSKFSFTGFMWEPPGYQAGTLITTKHLAHAAHYGMSVGTVVGFFNPTGSMISRTIIDIKTVPNTDIALAVLDAPLPQTITVYPVLKPYTSMSRMEYDLRGAPFLSLNSNLWYRTESDTRKAHWNEIASFSENYVGGTAKSDLPSFVNISQIVGDSGKPDFILVEGMLVFVFANHFAGYGSGPNYGSATNQAGIMAIIDPVAN